MAKELTKYLEPNSKLTDNGTFHKVNIHSSFQQITWGSLEPVQEDAASIRLTQISGNVWYPPERAKIRSTTMSKSITESDILRRECICWIMSVP